MQVTRIEVKGNVIGVELIEELGDEGILRHFWEKGIETGALAIHKDGSVSLPLVFAEVAAELSG